MGLPTINIPTYTLKIPSNKEEIKYRPFLVKEEKILLMAMEEDDDKQQLNAIRQIVSNCTFENVNANLLPTFDLEYIFLRIRAKSVGEISTLQLLCEDDGVTYAEVKVNLEEIEVEFVDDHTNIIELNDEVKIEMTYPTFEMLDSINSGNTEEVFNLISKCVKRIVEGETIYEKDDFTQKELNEFLENLNSEQFSAIRKFFDTMPKLTKEVKYKNPKTKKNNKMTLEGMQSFFG